MNRLLPWPLLSLVLWLTWLGLNNTVHPAHLALGAGIAVLLPLAIGRFLPELPRLGHPLVMLRLLVTVLGDIVVANLQVARRILGPESALKSAFVLVPLDLRHPLGIATLAGIVTLTPGTVSADLSDDGGSLLVHALHVDDEARLVRTIKQRYEAPLRAIFP
ncbi:MAG: Na+/H+ antiporter subunit E [Chromatiales bacterium]|nr:Na+/H+ antiporter subunit E [Chromatiales bacterium]